MELLEPIVCAGRTDIPLGSHVHPRQPNQVRVVLLAHSRTHCPRMQNDDSHDHAKWSRASQADTGCVAEDAPISDMWLCVNRFMVIPEMLKNAPMFKRIDPKSKVRLTALQHILGSCSIWPILLSRWE